MSSFTGRYISTVTLSQVDIATVTSLQVVDIATAVN